MNSSSYVIDINDNITTLARYDEKTKRFWYYRKSKDLPKLKLGQDIDKYKLGIEEINEDVVEAINEYKLYRMRLKEQYKDYNPLKTHELTLFNILDLHFEEQNTIDSFDNVLADITYMICKAMGLHTILTLPTEERAKYGIEYPEDIIEIADAIEDILSSGNGIDFYFYDFEDGKRSETKEYKEFKCKIEKRTHLNMNKIKTGNAVGEVILKLRESNNTYELKYLHRYSPYIKATNTTLIYNANVLDKESGIHRIIGHSKSSDNQRWTLSKLKMKRKKYDN